MMEELNFPVIKKPLPDAKWLSMEDYVKFVNFNLKYTLDRKANRKWKRFLAVKAPFSFK